MPLLIFFMFLVSLGIAPRVKRAWDKMDSALWGIGGIYFFALTGVVLLFGMHKLSYEKKTLTIYEYKEVSVLAEKKKCDEAGGEFGIAEHWSDLKDGDMYWINAKLDSYALTCIIPEKEIFNYQIN